MITAYRNVLHFICMVIRNFARGGDFNANILYIIIKYLNPKSNDQSPHIRYLDLG